MGIRLHEHAEERLAERGATREEVMTTILEGERFPAKLGRTGFRQTFEFGRTWRGKRYASKQLEVYAVEEADDWLVITVIARYF